MSRRMGVVVAVLGVFLAGASCDGVDPPPSTRIAAFESSVMSVERGDPVTLSWEVVNPGSTAGAFPCSITRRAEGQAAEEPFSVACTSSLTEVPPVPISSVAITYQLNALKRPYDGNDPYMTDSIVVTIVDPPSSTRIASFEASATSVTRGEAVTLTWQIERAGSADGVPSCSLGRRAENEVAMELQVVACSGSLTEVPEAPSTSSFIRYQLNALKSPPDVADPYATSVITVVLEDPTLPDPFDLEVTAGDSFFDLPVASIEVPAGATYTIKISIPTPLRGSRQRVVIEAGANSDALDLVLFAGDDFAPYASTSGPAYFRPGLAGLREGFYEPVFSTQSVEVVLNCVGPCIAAPAPIEQSHVFVELTNVGPGPFAVPLYAYVEPLIDTSEPDNDLLDLARVISLSSVPFRGAIELLGDHDFVRFADAGDVRFDERNGYNVNLIMELFEVDGGMWATIRPGETRFVFANEYARVRSDPLAPRASAFGFYTVGYEAD